MQPGLRVMGWGLGASAQPGGAKAIAAIAADAATGPEDAWPRLARIKLLAAAFQVAKERRGAEREGVVFRPLASFA